jgi:hypothetical protein
VACRRCLHRHRWSCRHQVRGSPGLAAQAPPAAAGWLRWLVRRTAVQSSVRARQLAPILAWSSVTGLEADLLTLGLITGAARPFAERAG